VTNNGPSPATGAAVTDAMPAGFNGATWTCTPSPGSSCAAPSGTGSIATTVTLLSGHTATFVVSGTIDPSASGSLANTATVAAPSGTTDPDSSDNSATGSVSLTVAADVSLAKSVLEPSVLPGQTFTFRISATNTGPSTATGVSVTDLLPGQLSFVSSPSACTAAGQTVTCPTLLTLSAGATMDFDVVVRLAPTYVGTGSDIGNVATASTTSPDPNATNNSNTPVGPSVGAPSADLSTAKAALETHVTPGGTITYRVVTTNNGPSTAVNVRATDPLPAPLTFVSSPSGCTAVGQNVSCGPVASVAPGAAATFDFVVQLDPAYSGNGSNLANVATSDSDSSDPESGEQPEPAGGTADPGCADRGSADREERERSCPDPRSERCVAGCLRARHTDVTHRA
jgi:uncharacterized repeat protein (TIGR01451 family)